MESISVSTWFSGETYSMWIPCGMWRHGKVLPNLVIEAETKEGKKYLK